MAHKAISYTAASDLPWRLAIASTLIVGLPLVIAASQLAVG